MQPLLLRTALALCLLLLAGLSAPGGVLFYAGFEGTADAVAVGDGRAQGHEGGPQFSPGHRGQALLSGEGAGYVSYAPARNLLPDRGSVELWVCPQDWEGSDGSFHVFLEAADPGWLLIYKYFAPGVGTGLFLISENHQTWSSVGQSFLRFKPGEWHHLVATWSRREICFYLDGVASARLARPPLPAGLSSRFLVGDRPWQFKRDARSRLDELYVYDRALSQEEVAWAYAHAADRVPGADLPPELQPPLALLVRPFPSRGIIRVEVEAGRAGLGQAVAGTACLQPAAGTAPAPIRLSASGTGAAEIPFRSLPRGDYQVQVELRDRQGRVTAAAAKLISPGPPVWRGNQIGLSTTPPPPWTPLRLTRVKDSPPSVACWGRRYDLGALALPRQVRSGGVPLLAGPVQLRIGIAGRPVTWRALASPQVEANQVRARLQGTADSAAGKLRWTCTADFDGLLRYDLVLTPRPGAALGPLELRVPLHPSCATLHHLVLTPTDTRRGATPAGQGAVFKAPWAFYWWLGNEQRGLAGCCESDQAWDRVDRPDGFRIERTPASVDAVWSFAAQPRRLTQDWAFTFALQATPVKDLTGWRKWRLAPGTNPKVYIQWAVPEMIRYFGFPQATDPSRYRALVRDHRAQGAGVVPYSLLNVLSSQVPEWSFYAEEWASSMAESTASDVMAYHAPIYGCSPARDWVDFIVWANHRYVRELGLGGLYHDFTMVMPSSNRLAGCGYLRDGVLRPTYPIFAVRELYRRIYTMLKDYGRQTGRETFMMGHMSSQMVIPLLSFCDAYLDGEHLAGLVKDNYLEVVSLDQWRAEFMGHNWGVMPYFLPEFQGERTRQAEPIERLVGLSLLHDFALWPNWCDIDTVNRYYRALDDFGLVDAQLLPYWSNVALVAGQSAAVKCTAYRKPAGGALLCVFNLTGQPQRPTLRVAWARVAGKRAVTVADAITGEPVPVLADALTVDIRPYNFRLLRVK